MATGSHPEYGLPEDYRQLVLIHAHHTSVAAAAEKFNVHPSSVYAWRRKEKENA